MSISIWEADKLLDMYIYDHMVKRGLKASAEAFRAEAKVSSDPVAIDAPGGFLLEWWSVFWDIFVARTNPNHSQLAASYNATQLIRAREQQQSQQLQLPQHQQMQQVLIQQQAPQQRQAQQLQQQAQQLQQQAQQLQQRRDGTHILTGNATTGLGGNNLLMRQNLGTANTVAPKMYEDTRKLPLQRDALDDPAMKQKYGENVGQLLDPSHASMLKSAAATGQPSRQVLQGKSAAGTSTQVQAQNQQLHRSSSGLDQLRPGILQQQKSCMQPGTQPFNQLQKPSSQHQQLGQQNLTSVSANEIETRKLQMLLSNNVSLNMGKDNNLSSSIGDVANTGSSLQSGGPNLPRGEPDMSLKVSKHLTVMNSSGTANTTGPSPNSAPSTPSTHTPAGDIFSMPTALQHNSSSSKPLMMFGTGSFTSTPNPLGNEKENVQIDMDHFVNDGPLDDNVESFLSNEDNDPRDVIGRCMGERKGFTFTEVNSVCASGNKVICCDFSSDGKMLVSGGHEKKAVLWYTDTLKPKTTLEEHMGLITDVRFSPNMPRLATCSFDKTVRVWDAENPGYSLCTFTGHSASVMSVDFHPTRDYLICSCDGDGEIRFWSINKGCCTHVFKGGNDQVRFQPRVGRYLAGAAEDVVYIFDVETQVCRHSLKGHTNPIRSVCWDPSGELLASVSEDSVRVWTVGSGSKVECAYELSCNGNKFHSCVFHPTYPSLLIIGCYQSLEMWNMSENKTLTLPAHDGLIADLAASTVTGLIASASHDQFVKLWK